MAATTSRYLPESDHTHATADLTVTRGLRVLLVEDNELNQEVASGLLQDAGISVDCAENGEIAVRKVRENSYDLVLMDMQMPVMNGLDATRAIRSAPHQRSLPIIAMTANAMAADREKCLEAGMNDHVAKPIEPGELFAAISRWVKPPNPPDGAAPATPASAGSSNDTRLEIPGVDTTSALKRIGGNHRRYAALLRKFAEQQDSAVEAIRAAMTAGNISEVERLAHSLKGAAGNLGADAIAEAALRTEAAAKTGQRIEETLASLFSSITSTAEAILRSLPNETIENGAAPVSGDRTAAVALLINLKKLLENDDAEAAEFMLNASHALSAILTKDEIENLTELVGNFDFEAALTSLSSISTRITVNPE